MTLDPFAFGAEQQCFGCGPHNHGGLKLRFERDGEEVITHWTPVPPYEGPPGLLHGGIQATLADELAAWAIVGLRGKMGLTSSMQLRLFRGARLGVVLEGRAKIVAEAEDVVTVEVKFTQENQQIFGGRISFRLLAKDSYERVVGKPLPEAWARFCL